MKKILLSAVVFALVPAWVQAASETVVGNVRVQTLSPTLVRLEQKGPRGFEDRVTFTVVERTWPGVPCKVAGNVVTTDHYLVRVANDGKSLAGTRIESPEGAVLYTFDGKLLAPAFLPPPANMPAAFVMADSARIVPRADLGWDVDNDAPDIYVFIPGKGGYEQLRRDFLRLTGPVPQKVA